MNIFASEKEKELKEKAKVSVSTMLEDIGYDNAYDLAVKARKEWHRKVIEESESWDYTACQIALETIFQWSQVILCLDKISVQMKAESIKYSKL